MIPAYIDGSQGAAGRLVFRGRPLAFWIEQAFPFCRFLDKPGHAQDYLWEGVYQLNVGDIDRALDHFLSAEKNNYRDAFLYYLMASAYLRKDDTVNCLRCVEKCLKKDEKFKVIVYNEPDFEPLQQNPDFLKLVE